MSLLQTNYFCETNFIRQSKAFQLYYHNFIFHASYYFTETNGDHIGYKISIFISDYGVPEHLTSNGLLMQTGSKTIFNELIFKHGIYHHCFVPSMPNKNPVETEIRGVKKRFYLLIHKKNIPN